MHCAHTQHTHPFLRIDLPHPLNSRRLARIRLQYAPMTEWWKKLWPILKIVIAVALLAAIGRQFWRDLNKLEQLGVANRPLQLSWLMLAGLLYLVGLSFSAIYWDRLLRGFEQRPSLVGMLRAYYVGHLGKYSPGKAWALLLRTGLARSDGVRLGVAAITATYEVLITMAAGVLLAVLLFAALGPDARSTLDWDALRQMFLLDVPEQLVLNWKLLVLFSLILLAPLAVATAPPIFNKLMRRITKPFRNRDALPLPKLKWSIMLRGLAITALGWVFLGASLLAVLHGVMPDPPSWNLRTVGLCTAYLSTAYVAGFLIFIVPGGLGVREFFLTLFLVPELSLCCAGVEGEGRFYALWAAILLRIVWTAAEVPIAALFYLLYFLRGVPELPPEKEVEGKDIA